jgi:hypothetical protein
MPKSSSFTPPPLTMEHVGRLYVTMNDPDIVRGAQRFEHAGRDVHGLEHVQTALSS